MEWFCSRVFLTLEASSGKTEIWESGRPSSQTCLRTSPSQSYLSYFLSASQLLTPLDFLHASVLSSASAQEAKSQLRAEAGRKKVPYLLSDGTVSKCSIHPSIHPSNHPFHPSIHLLTDA
jgi:hypothetical protein